MKESEYPHLGQLMAGYFHQDWSLEAPTWEGVVSLYMRDESACAGSTAQEIERLLADCQDDAQLETFLLGTLGSYFLPRSDLGGPDMRQWLQQVRAHLLNKQITA